MTTLKMNSYTRRRILASIKLGLAAIPFLMILRLIHVGNLNPGVFILGFGIGFSVGIAELFLFKKWIKNLPFFLHLFVKSIALVGIMWLTFAVLNLLDVFIDGISWLDYLNDIFQWTTLIRLLELLGVIVFLLFFIRLDRLLGPGVLIGYMTGRYHRPRKEHRIFMFLDLKGSTTLAERMDANHYFDFLHNYFKEMSEPILESNADIYQYVGDEIILTWRLKSGMEEANCIKVFFMIEKQMEARREYFLKTYGIVPEFKAGVHAGEVITAQIGELKSEITYNGDVLNTTARIQSLCNQYNQKLLVSADILKKIPLGPAYSIVNLGPVSIRGKEKTIDLCAVTKND